MLAILTSDFTLSIPDALSPTTAGQNNTTAFITQFLGNSTAHLINHHLNDHYARTALALAATAGIWFPSPAMADTQGPPQQHQSSQDQEAYER